MCKHRIGRSNEMKKETPKKIICIICAIAMLVSQGACAKGGDAKTTASSSAASGEKDIYPAEDGPLTPYKDTVTVTQVKYSDPNTTYIDGESEKDNFIRKLYKDVLNVEWKSTWTSDPNGYYTKLNLDIASNDLPDVFMVSPAQLKGLIASDQIMDLTPVYNHYVSDRLRANIEYNNKYAIQYPTVDGKLYGIPLTSAYESDIAFMWLRTDWMKKLNLKAPTTYDEFVSYVNTVKESGIAKASTSGFSFLGVGSVSFNAIAQMDGSYFDCWLKNSAGDGLVYGSIQPTMKETLTKLQNMYKQGIIDKDYATKNLTEQEAITRGQYGILFGQYFYPYLLKGNVALDSNATWDAYPIPTTTGNSPKPKSSGFTKGYVVVRKGYAHPEAAVKSMNLWAEIWLADGSYNEWYAEKFGTTYKDISIIGEYALPYTFDGVTNTMESSVKLRKVFNSSSPETEILNYPNLKYTYNLLSDIKNPKYITGNGWFLKTMNMTSERVMSENYKDIQLNQFQGILSDDMALVKTTLDKLMYETFMGIIEGDSISKFDEFVSDWKDLGGDDLTKEVNKWYKNH